MDSPISFLLSGNCCCLVQWRCYPSCNTWIYSVRNHLFCLAKDAKFQNIRLSKKHTEQYLAECLACCLKWFGLDKKVYFFLKKSKFILKISIVTCTLHGQCLKCRGWWPGCSWWCSCVFYSWSCYSENGFNGSCNDIWRREGSIEAFSCSMFAI